MTAIFGPDDAAPDYSTYIDKVRDGDILSILEAQAASTRALWSGISEEQSHYRYAPGKWTIKEAGSHVNDTERVFAFRALWFARGFPDPLPSFDQDVAIAGSGANARSWRSHVDEFGDVRAATLAFFRQLPPDAWTRRGVAGGNPFSVRALAYIIAGHVEHHDAILRDRYLTPAG